LFKVKQDKDIFSLSTKSCEF